ETAVTSQSAYFPLPLFAALAANPDTSVKYVGAETLNGSSAQHLQIWNTFASVPDLQPLAGQSMRDVWLDGTSGLPVKISFIRRPHGSDSANLRVEVFLSDYRSVSGFLYPFSIHVSLNGTPWATISIQGVTFNNGLDDSSFAILGDQR